MVLRRTADCGPASRVGEAVFGLPFAVFSDHHRGSHNLGYGSRSARHVDGLKPKLIARQ